MWIDLLNRYNWSKIVEEIKVVFIDMDFSNINVLCYEMINKSKNLVEFELFIG